MQLQTMLTANCSVPLNAFCLVILLRQNVLQFVILTHHLCFYFRAEMVNVYSAGCQIYIKSYLLLAQHLLAS